MRTIKQFQKLSKKKAAKANSISVTSKLKLCQDAENPYLFELVETTNYSVNRCLIIINYSPSISIYNWSALPLEADSENPGQSGERKEKGDRRKWKMKPQQRILFIINIVLHMICIIPVTSRNHIHHSTLSGENSYSTNRGECCEQTNMKIFSL